MTIGLAKMTRNERKAVLLKEMKESVGILEDLAREPATRRITNLLAGIILYLEEESKKEQQCQTTRTVATTRELQTAI